MEKNKKVLLGMSGGVDSSVSATLLKDAGYDVVGTTLELYAGSSCCNINTYLDAKLVCKNIGISDDKIFSGIEKLMPISGRFNVQKLPNKAYVVIDYAHTPDGLKNVLTTAKEICILADDATVASGEYAEVPAYFTGEFNDAKVIFPFETGSDDHDEIVEAVREPLRRSKIFLRHIN